MSELEELKAQLEAVERLCKWWDTLADGDRHYAQRIRKAIEGAAA